MRYILVLFLFINLPFIYIPFGLKRKNKSPSMSLKEIYVKKITSLLKLTEKGGVSISRMITIGCSHFIVMILPK